MCVEILTIGVIPVVNLIENFENVCRNFDNCVTPVVNLIENFENVCRNFDNWCNSCCIFN